MAFTQKFIECDFSLAQGQFQGGGNSFTAKNLRIHATIVKAGGVSFGEAEVEIYGLPLSVMNQLSTFGIEITQQGRNSITIKAGEDSNNLTVVYVGDIYNAYMDGQAQPQVPFRVLARVAMFAGVQPIPPTSQPGSQDVATLAQSMAQTAGLQFENNGVSTRLQNPYYPGTATQQIVKLADHAGIEHIIDCGTLAIWPTNGYRAGSATLISPQTGLVSYPAFNSMGVIVRTLWQPTLTFGGLIQVQSSITGACGQWRIYKLTYDLASMDPRGPWFCDVWASPPGQMVVSG